MAVRTWRNRKSLYNLVGGQCDSCQAVVFPQRLVCGCGSTSFTEKQMQGAGKIETFTVIRTTAANENIDIPARSAPYILAIIQLAEGPRLTAEVVDCDVEEVHIGSAVESVFRKITEKGEKGVIQYGYKFRLAGPQ